MAKEHEVMGERKARIASAFCFAEMALRVAGIGDPKDRSAVIRNEKGKWCVRSSNNPDWSGGCYDTKEEARERLRQVEAAKHAKASSSDGGDWIPAAGGTEEPFLTRDGRRLLYVWNPRTREHAYLDLNTDLILSDEEARIILGSMVHHPSLAVAGEVVVARADDTRIVALFAHVTTSSLRGCVRSRGHTSARTPGLP